MQNTIEILISAKDAASSVIGSIGDSLSSAGGSLVKWGAALTVATAGIGLALGQASNEALKYNESITNTAAVLGITGEAQTKLSNELLDFSKNTRAGAQEVAASYYDIVGGVADASTHMAILTAANKTAEAGNTDLGSTTKALISVMNSYKLSAEGAGMASDVLTQVVNKGVGTMGDFASALPQVTGLANSLGISFTDVGAATAFLTTKGNTASQAVTQLRGMMVALLNPNANMKKGLEELGFANGQAAIKSLGLVGAMNALKNSQEAGKDGFASMTGSVEALNGAIALGDATFTDFNKTFTDTTKGATDAAQAIQNFSPAAQLDFLNSSAEALKITIGNALLPALTGLIEHVRPIIDAVTAWMTANPELTGTIIALVGGLVALGPILAAVGGAIMFIASPIGIIIAAVAGLGIAFATNFGGIRDAVMPVITMLSTVWNDVVLPKIQEFIAWFTQTALPAVVSYIQTTVIPWVQNLIDILIKIWNDVSPFLVQLADWFLNTILPAIVGFITETVIPTVQTFIETLSAIWTKIQPGLTELYNWFITTALPGIIDFVKGPVTTVFNTFIGVLSGIWGAVKGGLELFKNNIDAIFSWIHDHVIQPFLDIINGIINTINDIGNRISGLTGAAQNASTAAGLVASGQVSPGQFLQALGNAIGAEIGGPHATGVDFIARPQMALLHRGERVMTANENAAFTDGGQGTTLNFGPGSVVVHAGTEAEGAAGARGFYNEIEELLRSRNTLPQPG